MLPKVYKACFTANKLAEKMSIFMSMLDVDLKDLKIIF